VEGADYTVWADNYQQTGLPAWSDGGWAWGNFNADDVVEGADYTIWADNYSPPAPPAAAAADDGVSAQTASPFAGSAEGGNSAVLDRQRRVLPMAAGEMRVLPLGPGLPAEASGQAGHRRPDQARANTPARPGQRQASLDDQIDILAAPELSVLPAAAVGRAARA
jgi:hypothetical protein